MKYHMLNKEWGVDEVIVDLKKTAKTTTITPLCDKPKFTSGCIDQLWDDGKIVIREPRPGGRVKITKHVLRDWNDGTYTLYPERAGIPFLLTPLDNEDDNQN